MKIGGFYGDWYQKGRNEVFCFYFLQGFYRFLFFYVVLFRGLFYFFIFFCKLIYLFEEFQFVRGMGLYCEINNFISFFSLGIVSVRSRFSCNIKVCFLQLRNLEVWCVMVLGFRFFLFYCFITYGFYFMSFLCFRMLIKFQLLCLFFSQQKKGRGEEYIFFLREFFGSCIYLFIQSDRVISYLNWNYYERSFYY